MDINLLQRYIEGNTTPQERLAVAEWLEADEANVREATALHKLHDIAVWNRESESNTTERTALKVRLRRVATELLKIAAVFALAFAAYSYLGNKEQADEEPAVAWQTFSAPPGQRAQLLLPDSTTVWLNSGSTITYPTSFSRTNRTVAFEGEGYFDVTHDEEHPFTVKTPKIDVRVLGTEFNVIAYSDNEATEVALVKGKVELMTEDGQTKIYTMKENENVRVVGNVAVTAETGNASDITSEAATGSGKTAVKRLTAPTLTASRIKNPDYFEWRNGIICFDDEPLDRMMHKLQRLFDVTIVTPDAPFMKRRYTGKFRSADGIEHVLRVIKLRERFDYEVDKEKNVITIK